MSQQRSRRRHRLRRPVPDTQRRPGRAPLEIAEASNPPDHLAHIRRALRNGKPLTAREVMRLQRTVGNRAVMRMMPASSKKGGQCFAFPDVCKTPAPPAPFVPIPYPNIGTTTGTKAGSKEKTKTTTKTKTGKKTAPATKGEGDLAAVGISSAVAPSAPALAKAGQIAAKAATSGGKLSLAQGNTIDAAPFGRGLLLVLRFFRSLPLWTRLPWPRRRRGLKLLQAGLYNLGLTVSTIGLILDWVKQRGAR